MFAKFLSDAAWYFYLFWLPKYLYDARNFDVKASRRVRVDSLCRRRRWVLGGRLAFELSRATGIFCRLRTKAGSGIERRGHASDRPGAARRGVLGDCNF